MAWNRYQGFTLLEMMVVVAIIAILVTLALPNQLPRTGRLQLEEVLKYCDNLKPAITVYYTTNKSFPTSNVTAGLPEPEKLVSTLIQNVTVENGALQITLGNNIIAPLQNEVLTLQPLFVPTSPESPIDWSCAFSKIPPGMEAVGENKTSVPNAYLPLKCRAL